MAKLLLADDDATLVMNISEWLMANDYLVETASTAEDTVAMLETYQFDLILIDWEFPDGTGINIVSSFRRKGLLTPIIMLTGKSSQEEKERGLDAGADDYLTKPFQMGELGARLRALSRRPPIYVHDELSVGLLKLDSKKCKARFRDKESHLQPIEYSVLEFFMHNPGQLFSADKIIERVWESSADVSHQAVYSAIKRLRKKLDSPGAESLFRNVPGMGYELTTRDG